MAYRGRKGKRRWGRKYRRYRHPAERSHVTEYKIRALSVIDLPASQVGTGFQMRLWQFEAGAQPFNTIALNNQPFFNNLSAPPDGSAPLYSFIQCKAMKMKIWPWRPGGGSYVNWEAREDGGYYDPVPPGANSRTGNRPRGNYFIFHEFVWNRQNGTPFPMPNINGSNPPSFYINAYPNCKFRWAADDNHFNGKPAHSTYLHIPKTFREGEWVSGQDPPCAVGANNIAENSNPSINVSLYDHQGDSDSNQFIYSLECVWYVSFYGRTAGEA